MQKIRPEVMEEYISQIQGILLESKDFGLYVIKIPYGEPSTGYRWRAFGIRRGELSDITHLISAVIGWKWDAPRQAMKTGPFVSDGDEQLMWDIKEMFNIDIKVKEL